MNYGYIKLYRSLLDWEWYSDVNVRMLFVHLLLTVNYEPSEFKGIKLSRSQRIYSVKKLAEETGISESQVRTAISKLISTGELSCETSPRYSILTVKNYDKFQSPAENESQTNHELNRKLISNKMTNKTANSNFQNDGVNASQIACDKKIIANSIANTLCEKSQTESTEIRNSLINNNIINNNSIYSGGDDACVRENAAEQHETALIQDDSGTPEKSYEIPQTKPTGTPSGFLGELDCYFGMTITVKFRLYDIAKELFSEFFDRMPTPPDVIKLFPRVATLSEQSKDGQIIFTDERIGVCRYAFEKAAQSGRTMWYYLDGIFDKLDMRGLNTYDACMAYDVQRDFKAM